MPGNDSKDRTVGTGEVGTDELETRAMEQDRWDRTVGVELGDRTGQTEKTVRTAWKGNRGQYGQNMTATTRGLGQGNRDRTTVAGQSGYRMWDRTIKRGQLGTVHLDGSV
jgi:hypothetical protein